jgi:acyl-coenzyme A thioesterase PaaI-like protein
VSAQPTDRASSAWDHARRRPEEGTAQWGELIESYREFSSRLAASHVSPAEMTEISGILAGLAARLAPSAVPETQRFSGRTPGVPVRGHPLLVPVTVDTSTPTSMSGRVTFSDLYLGGNGAAHGGTQPLMFDDVLGIMVTQGGTTRLRTASLTVNYRRIAPINVELQVEATVDQIDGRKIWATGRLWNKAVLLADAVGLFVVLRDHQP